MVFAKCIPGFFFYERLQVNTYIKDEKVRENRHSDPQWFLLNAFPGFFFYERLQVNTYIKDEKS